MNILVQKIHFDDQETTLVLFNRLTEFVRYEKMKMEKNFFEMITATVSHDMRTPLNAISGLV